MGGSATKYEVSTRDPVTRRFERWRIRWELPPDPYTGERRQGSRAGFTTRKAAEQALADIMGKVKAGTYVVPSRQRLAAYLTSWLTGLRLKPTTLDCYRVAIEVHIIPRLGGIPLSELTPEHLDGLYRELEEHGKAVRIVEDGKRVATCRTAGVTCRANGCSPDRHGGLKPKSIRHVHGTLRKALQDALERGHVGRNVADMANPPTARQSRSRRAREQCWTLAQLRHFLDATRGDRFEPIWQLIATTGMRRAEVCGLRWQDIDLDRGRLRVAQTITEVRGRPIEQEDGKSDAAARIFALDSRTVDALQLWRARQAEDELAAEPGAWTDSGLVFTDLSGRGYLPRRVSAAFTKAVDAADLPHIGVHGLRHTYATAALRAGVSPEVVSKRLGHSSVLITLSIYAHVFEQDDEAAAELAAAAIYGA